MHASGKNLTFFNLAVESKPPNFPPMRYLIFKAIRCGIIGFFMIFYRFVTCGFH